MSTLSSLLRNGTLLRSLASFGFAFTAEWAFTVAIGLVAYADGGALAVGVVALVRLLPAALLSPLITAYADRMPRERVLITSSGARGLATLAAAAVLLTDGSTTLVYALAVLSTIAFVPFRAGHSALLPSLCRTPEELTAVNVARGALDSASVMVGSLAAGLLVAVADLATVFVFAGTCALVSAALLLRLRYERSPVQVAAGRRLLVEIRDGAQAVRTIPGLGLVVGLVVLQAAIRGAFTVFVVVVAIDVLTQPDSAVGVLQSAVGVGALVGSGLSTLLVGSRAMARWLGVAVAMWGAPLAVMGLAPSYVVAVVAMATIGVGNALVDVTAFTLIARMAPDAVLARVFGLLESAGALAVGAGSLLVPLLLGPLGPRSALVVAGLIAPAVCLAVWARLAATDRRVAVRTDDITLLRRVPMLEPLPVPVLEHLARDVRRLDVAEGDVVFEAGDRGDDFYVVSEGRVEVLDRGRPIRTLGPGSGFGEIALLRETPRTMTIRAAEPTGLRAIERDAFLTAVTSISGARAAAERTTWSHLSHAPGHRPETPP